MSQSTRCVSKQCSLVAAQKFVCGFYFVFLLFILSDAFPLPSCVENYNTEQYKSFLEFDVASNIFRIFQNGSHAYDGQSS